MPSNMGICSMSKSDGFKAHSFKPDAISSNAQISHQNDGIFLSARDLLVSSLCMLLKTTDMQMTKVGEKDKKCWGEISRLVRENMSHAEACQQMEVFALDPLQVFMQMLFLTGVSW